MKGLGKAIGAGIAVILVGVIVLIVALGLNDWKFESMTKYEMKNYESSEEISTIKLDFAIGTIKTEFYDGDKIKIDYPENDYLTTTITEENGILTASANRNKRWWMNFGIFLKKLPTTVISIPRNSSISLDFEINAGTVNVADGNYESVKLMLNAGTVTLGDITCTNLQCNVNAGTFNVKSVICEKVKCDLNAGTVNLSNVLCDDIKVDVSAGTANIQVKGEKAAYNITASVSAGSCNVKNQHGSDANKNIDVDVSAGTVNIKFN